jgi:hypothetical protein
VRRNTSKASTVEPTPTGTRPDPIAELREQIESLRTDIAILRLNQQRRNRAYLGPEDNGFAAIDTDVGIFFISMKSMKKHGDGYKLSLTLGNPQFATFSNVKLRMRWGKRHGTVPMLDESTARSLETPIYKSLRPGSWNPVEVVVAPAAEDEVGAIEIQMTVPTVRMN